MAAADPLTPAVRAGLAAAARLLSPARAPWWVIGSAAVALHGADPGAIADIDILLDPDDAARLLPPAGIALAAGTADGLFRSALFGRWTEAPLPVEFMAGLAVRTGTGWHPVRLDPPVRIALGNTELPLPGRAALHALLRLFGRPKDHRRAAALAATAGPPVASSGTPPHASG
ncbi:hypothetical protein [Sphingomonas morindae]|uniref:Nucleotidyltransferase family protein n=1 Tax=Sphingomonas morindae TaxID=1541170 RepID=A0ABY4X767_9SPHN|nr:hypothetical protein [Sphingomonas morindae]USI72751.1 hypothetical protein LHA26_15990 [Sphingomonas morindae]